MRKFVVAVALSLAFASGWRVSDALADEVSGDPPASSSSPQAPQESEPVGDPVGDTLDGNSTALAAPASSDALEPAAAPQQSDEPVATAPSQTASPPAAAPAATPISQPAVSDADAKKYAVYGAIALAGLLAISLFFLPTTIAYRRQSRHRFIILILNCTVAFTGLGWLAIFVVAVWPKGDAVPIAMRADPAAPPQPLATAAAEPAPSPLRQLEKLGELRDAGVLSEDEFTRKKKQILSAS